LCAPRRLLLAAQGRACPTLPCLDLLAPGIRHLRHGCHSSLPSLPAASSMEVAPCPLRTCGRSGRSNWPSLANCSKSKASQPPPSPEHFDARRPTPNPETSKGCQRHPFATRALWRCRVALYSRTNLGRNCLTSLPRALDRACALLRHARPHRSLRPEPDV